MSDSIGAVKEMATFEHYLGLAAIRPQFRPKPELYSLSRISV